MTSLCKRYYQFLLAQGLALGVSNAFLLTPAMATVSHMFDRNRGMATGIMIAGSSVGGIIWPVMLDQLLNSHKLSFGSSFRIVGYVVVPICIIIVLSIQLPRKAEQARPPEGAKEEKREETEAAMDEKPKSTISVLKNPTFILLCIGLSVATLGLFTPLFFIPTYAVANGLSASVAFYLVSMLNGASLVGRVSTGILADRYGNFNLCFVTIALSGIIAMCWTGVTSKVGIILFTLAYGYTSGVSTSANANLPLSEKADCFNIQAMFSLQTPCAVQLATPESRGTAIGLLMVAPALP